MGYLLDTCTISEMVAKWPDANVVDWFEDQDESSLYLSVITWGELQRGILQLPAGKRRVKLETWLSDELRPLFEGRIVDVDQKVISTWARMLASFKPKGIIRASLDSLIEATAIQNDLIIVTRNEKNFHDSHASVLNPWNA